MRLTRYLNPTLLATNDFIQKAILFPEAEVCVLGKKLQGVLVSLKSLEVLKVVYFKNTCCDTHKFKTWSCEDVCPNPILISNKTNSPPQTAGKRGTVLISRKETSGVRTELMINVYQRKI